MKLLETVRYFLAGVLLGIGIGAGKEIVKEVIERKKLEKIKKEAEKAQG